MQAGLISESVHSSPISAVTVVRFVSRPVAGGDMLCAATSERPHSAAVVTDFVMMGLATSACE